ncbi:MAG: hypothetical protein JEY96_17475 [Bacteroidales bacterium]|nr:hypothetical protein [Bacteroidales bacterium]
MRRYIAFISCAVSMGIIFFSGWFDKPVLGYNKIIYVILISAVYLSYVIYAYLMNFNFFSYNDEGDEFIFRFVSLRPFDNTKKSIVIKKGNFRGFEIRKSLFGLKQELILFVETNKGKIPYPAISISAVESKYIKILKMSLNTQDSKVLT